MHNKDFGVKVLGMKDSRRLRVNISWRFSLDFVYKSRDPDKRLLSFEHYLDIVIVQNIM